MPISDQPKTINVKPYALHITWTDGHVSEYPMRYLRAECRCANCINELTGDQMLDKSTIPEGTRCLKAEPTGHYALSFSFSDGHKTGIYTYTHLRGLCPCSLCVLS